MSAVLHGLGMSNQRRFIKKKKKERHCRVVFSLHLAPLTGNVWYEEIGPTVFIVHISLRTYRSFFIMVVITRFTRTLYPVKSSN